MQRRRTERVEQRTRHLGMQREAVFAQHAHAGMDFVVIRGLPDRLEARIKFKICDDVFFVFSFIGPRAIFFLSQELFC